MGTEIVGLVHRPAHSDVDGLHENAGPLPLDIHESVDVRAVAVFLFLLVIELAQCRTVTRNVPLRVVCDIGADLHLHHVLDDVELPVPSCVQGHGGNRDHVLIGRELDQHLVVQMDSGDPEVLVQCEFQHAHRALFLLRDGIGVIIYMILHQCPGSGHVQFPSRHVIVSLHLGPADLAEIIVPDVVVGVIMLLVELRLVETGLEMRPECHRALLVPAERIYAESGVSLYSGVVDFLSEEGVPAFRTPVEILLPLTSGSSVDVGGVPDSVPFAVHYVCVLREEIVVQQSVSYAHVQG